MGFFFKVYITLTVNFLNNTVLIKGNMQLVCLLVPAGFGFKTLK